MKVPTAKIVYIPMYYDKEKNGNDCIAKKEEGKEYWWKFYGCGHSGKMTLSDFLFRVENNRSSSAMNVMCPKCYLDSYGAGKFNSESDYSFIEDEEVKNYIRDLSYDFNWNGVNSKYVDRCMCCGELYTASIETVIKRGRSVCKSCAVKKSLIELLKDKDIENYYCKDLNPPIESIFLSTVHTKTMKFNLICPRCGKIHLKSVEAIDRSGCYCEQCARLMSSIAKGNTVIVSSIKELDDMYTGSKLNSIPSNQVSAQSSEEAYFLCKKGKLPHIFKKSIANTYNACKNHTKTRGCPVCAGWITLEGVNDFKTMNPEIAACWDYDNNESIPESIYYMDERKYNFICRYGHHFSSDPCHLMRSIGTSTMGCPVCHGKKIIVGENDLFSVYPEKASEWDYAINELNPKDLTAGSNKIAKFHCKKCGKIYETTIYNWSHDTVICCEDCRNTSYSVAEKELVSFIRDELGFDVEENVYIKGINGSRDYNLDMVIPSKGIAFEYNGLYWHTEDVHWATYHKNKLDASLNYGIRVYTVWEDTYLEKPDLVKNFIKQKLGVSDLEKVSARDCVINMEKYSDVKDFVNKNHYLGMRGGSYYLTLRDKNNKLRAVMIFTDAMNGDLCDITRYCTDCNLRGGFSKLLKYIEDNGTYGLITTFSDNMLSDGELYKNNGFDILKKIPCDFYYLINNKRVNRQSINKEWFLHHGYEYIEEMSEVELASYNGIKRIYDAGKIKWYKKIK